jgi:tyrosine-protein phosphatase SIW14
LFIATWKIVSRRIVGEKYFPSGSNAKKIRRRRISLSRAAVRRRFYLRLIMILALISAACAVALRIYSVHENAVIASYAPSIPAVADKLNLPGIPNAGKVSEFLYRGAQPHAAGYRELQHLGISIVVDLRSSPEEQAAEQRAVEQLGMEHIAMPTNGFFGPTDNQVAAFLQLLRDNPKRKAFVHCYFGDDRTGVMIAAYRMVEQHWLADQAYNEMRAYHFHRHLILIGHYVKYFPANFTISPAFAALRNAPQSQRPLTPSN